MRRKSRRRCREGHADRGPRSRPTGAHMLQRARTGSIGGAARRPTVLVVDDDESVRESLALALELEGYMVLRAAHGIDALLVLRTGIRPDVILLDLEMPVMPGWEFRERQLADPALADIPVVIVSSSLRQVSADRR